MPFRATAGRHPLTSFFVLAFAFSWGCWAVSALGYRGGVATALLVLGGFGPLVAALIMVRLSGDSVKRWFRGLFRWRVAPRWYLFAIGVPIALAVLVTAEFALAGNDLDWSLLDTRLAAFLPTLVFVALLQGETRNQAGADSRSRACRTASRRCEPRCCSAGCGRSGTSPPVRHG